MLLLVTIFLILWIPGMHGQVKTCDYPEIRHGRLLSPWFNRLRLPVPIGIFFYYQCDDNFLPPTQQNQSEITCTTEGWLPKSPCLRICALNYLQNGIVSNRERSYYEGDTVTVDCYPGYSLENGEDTVTCTEYDWVPPAKCIRIKACSKSQLEIENGFITEADNTYPLNKEAHYRCKPGYLTEHGNETGSIICLEDGWSLVPKCIKSCDAPVFVNARGRNVGTWFKLNDQLEYECDHGYESRTGSTTGSIECGDSGWSGKPVCYERKCKIPKVGRYVHVFPAVEKQKVGSVVKFRCRENRKRVGPDSSQCYHFGWSPPFPTCEVQVKSCTPPPELPGGEIKEELKAEYEHNDVVQYACSPRYLMKGAAKVQCVDGQWTPLPECIEEVRTCGEIPGLDHGSAEPSLPPYHHGDSVNLTCEEGFTIVGDKSVTCIKGQWTQLPKCIATDELKICKPPNLPSIHASRPYSHNTKLNYKCRGKSENKQSICINGKWEPEVSCTEVQRQNCPPPPQIPNAKAMTTTVNYQDGEKISILCEDNFLLEGTEEMTCINGKWQSIPHCMDYRGKCGTPPPIDNGDITSVPLKVYAPESRVKYQCQNSYKLEGNAIIRCHNGEWTEPPKCLDPCVISEDIMNKHNIQFRWVDEKKLYAPSWDFVEFACKQGYRHISSAPLRVPCIEGKIPYPTCG